MQISGIKTLSVGLAAWAAMGLAWAQSGKQPLTFEDVMRFRDIHDPVISAQGDWIAYELRPDRGDGQARFRSLTDGRVWTVDRGSRPALAKDSRWGAARIEPPQAEAEKKKGPDAPQPGMALLDLAGGEAITVDRVQRFEFSDDSQWLAYQLFEEKEDKKQDDEKKDADRKKKKEKLGTTLVIRRLSTGKEVRTALAGPFRLDPQSMYAVYSKLTPEGKENGLYCRDLRDADAPEKKIVLQEKGIYESLTWSREGSRLAFLAAVADDKDKPGPAELWIWEGVVQSLAKAADSESFGAGWTVPAKNEVVWTRDGERIFFGVKPASEIDSADGDGDADGDGEDDPKEEESSNLYDMEEILKKREVDVWHWNDPWIKTQEKKLWERLKDRTYLAVYHRDEASAVRLGDENLARIPVPQNPQSALGLNPRPYLKQTTWDEDFRDVYWVDLADGSRKRVAMRLEDYASLSPDGRYVAFFEDRHWRLYDSEKDEVRNLTGDIETPFDNEDHDYPGPAPSYRIAGWVEGDHAVLIYDKYDVWEFVAETGRAVNLTDGMGRREKIVFRVVRTDPEQESFPRGGRLLLNGYRDRTKNNGFYAVHEDRPGPRKLIEKDRRFRFVAKAKEVDRFLYTRESYAEFPDLWVAGPDFESAEKVTDANPEMSRFAWGSAELVQWRSLDGVPLQGVLIKPGNYDPQKRYPVLVYFYRFFSQRLHQFNQPVVNHRPCFPLYASNGYAIFLPDIRFEVGRPGLSSMKSLLPGVQKLVDMGVADPRALGLHGHSWSGYQTAHIITLTNMFAAAVAGAPVSNMTSAYGGIRLGSGRARQFQYEETQSRIGGSLWEYPERYIENSPLFFADRIETPLLIQFGDRDNAVPWEQGIELYLAMRRLGKECVFLQYRDEPHHLQKYPNKLDYAIKMMEWFDHYLKGAPAPKWITEGVPYRGK